MAACLAAVSKSVQKLATTTAKAVVKCCRAAINKGKVAGDPKNCSTNDDKAVAKIAAAEQAVRATVAATCSFGELAELDLCGLGIGGIGSVAVAQECLATLGREVGDSSEVPAERLFAPVSIVEAAYPPRAVCGDGVINQLPNPFLLLGEECDGGDDAACPGVCLPPGDLFECTCGDKPRVRAFASTLLTDSDAGWTGNSHDQGNADQSGFIVNLSNCDCDRFTGADWMRVRDNDVNVEFQVKVPAGVRFVGRTVNGGIEASGIKADAEAETVNGSVELDSTGTARAQTVNGGITARLGRADWEGTLKLETVNGGIEVSMPEGLSADVRASTVNGDISTDFPLTVTGKIARRKLEGTCRLRRPHARDEDGQRRHRAQEVWDLTPGRLGAGCPPR